MHKVSSTIHNPATFLQFSKVSLIDISYKFPRYTNIWQWTGKTQSFINSLYNNWKSYDFNGFSVLLSFVQLTSRFFVFLSNDKRVLGRALAYNCLHIVQSLLLDSRDSESSHLFLKFFIMEVIGCFFCRFWFFSCKRKKKIK